MINYRVLPLSPERHLFQVTVRLENVQGELVWRLPAWVPGSYMIRDFARNVVHIHARCGEQPVALTKLDKQTWKTAAVDGALEMVMEVHAHDTSVRAAFLDNRYGFFDGTSLFLLPDGYDAIPCQVEILPPEGAPYLSWEMATGLNAAQQDKRGFGVFTAANYAELIDCPVLMGALTQATFEVRGVPHRIVLSGRHQADMARLCRDVQKICEQQVSVFDALPMTNYTFLTMVSGDGYGGLEHRNSTALACSRQSLPQRGDSPATVRDDYRTLLGLFSHEYFHSWNVKRIKPAAFTPYNLTQENYTSQLWAFEGITSYYDDLALVRSGVITPDSYLELLGQTLTRVARGRGRFKQSMVASSFDAWTRFYKQDASAPNVIVSYYTKGTWVALALDLTIRTLTQGAKSLDDVMRLLWQRYGRSDADIATGVPENGVQQAAEEVAGQSLQAFFAQALEGTEDVNLTPLLAPLGVELQWRAAASHADKGGKPATAGLHLGALLAADPAGVRLTVVYEQGAAMQAGLAAGDVLLALDGIKTTQSNLDALLAQYVPGDKVRLHAFRGDELLTADVVLGMSEPDFASLALAAGGLSPTGRDWLKVGA